MKTLKTVTVLLFTMALFFSCAQENFSDYGTLVIKLSGSSARAVKGEISSEFGNKLESENISYKFEFMNEEVVVDERGPYPVGVDQDVPIRLSPGAWVVQVKVLQKVFQDQKFQGEEVIGSAQYKPFTIKAGQTVILGGISVPTSPYGVAIAHKAQPGFNYENLDSWPDTSTINIDRYLKLDDVTGYVLTGASQPSSYVPDASPAPHGTAKILWDEDNLYVLVLVEDAKKSTNKGLEAQDTDSVEIFFNENGIGHQYRMDYAGITTYGYYDSSYKKDQPLPSGVVLSIIKDNLDVSYAVVAKIPLTSNSEGKTIGIDLQINGAPVVNGGIRSTVAVWYDKTATAYSHPELYEETLTLVE